VTSSLPSATISEQDGIRFLHLDTPWVQGAMAVRAPNVIVLEYVQRMMAWMLWRRGAQVASGHAVQLGLGAGTITRFCLAVMKMPRVTAV
jgi:spermidine synthase